MGEEADADWQAGLVEWGREDAKPAVPAKRFRCPTCNKGFRLAIGLAHHDRDKHGGGTTILPSERENNV